MHHSRPVRGVIRLDDLSWDPSLLQADLARFQESDWEAMHYSDKWKQIMVAHPNGEGGTTLHPRMADCPTLQAVFDAFPGKLLDASIASLAPGGSVGEHRDISGGTPMGVGRFHVPIVSDPGVEFYVSGKKLYLAPGETWNLDTSYPHWLQNLSDITRVHLIVDVELTPQVKEMLPPTDMRDRAHRVHFAAICAAKGLELAVKDPRALAKRVRKFVKLLVFNQSVLRPED
ncbi:MAG: aspartyl/asparaginyl beta-hydroxylase domain-containing protein [Deltaproteobacteria bacterium]|nr:aspartyl/asparaginyl beta-hydroxylase domain-containing protein [Deltaproteobacteria bacterium]